MTKQWAGLTDEVALRYAYPLAAFAVALLILLIARSLLTKWLYANSRGEGAMGYIAIETLRFPSILWCVAAAVQFGLEISIIPPKYTGRASTAITAFLIMSFSMVLASASVRALAMHGKRKGVALAQSGLPRTLIRVLIFTCGAAAVLALYGVKITALLTALGIGGLAVALALQDTLANFFAGIHILIEEPIALGSFIQLSSGEEGVVTDIGWRTTRVRNGANNVIVIPNTKITSGILTNYNLPEVRLAAEVAVIAGYGADPDQVRLIALEETRRCGGVLASPEPQVLFNPGVTPTHLQFTVTFWAPDFSRKGPLQSEVRLRIYRRLRAEGVPVPQPSQRMEILAED
jgi:small-conductance mechanosensitive channel